MKNYAMFLLRVRTTMPLILYTMPEATRYFNDEKHLNITEETLRNRMKSAYLTIYKVGNLDLVTQDDIDRLMDTPEPKRGRPTKK